MIEFFRNSRETYSSLKRTRSNFDFYLTRNPSPSLPSKTKMQQKKRKKTCIHFLTASNIYITSAWGNKMHIFYKFFNSTWRKLTLWILLCFGTCVVYAHFSHYYYWNYFFYFLVKVNVIEYLNSDEIQRKKIICKAFHSDYKYSRQ